MKKPILLFLFLLVFHGIGNAQSMKDLFQESDVKFYWFGIDFSHTRLIGTFNQYALDGETDPATIKNKYFPAWNAMFIREADKYNVSKMLHGKTVEVSITEMYKINDKGNVPNIEAAEVHYTPQQIREFVKDYDFKRTDGIGAFFLTECLNKEKEHGIYHIVFLNLANNEVLYTESFTGRTRGFGIRNYYAYSFSEVMEEIEKKAYPKWQKESAGE